MIVSWNWLKRYVKLDMPLVELEQRLMMSGLNHEETNEVDGDFAIDLEVTSNRPDCLGHLGIAREIAALWERDIKIPEAKVPEAKTTESKKLVSDLTKVTVECPDLCYQYSARVITGVKVGPSPDWMVQHLHTIGIPSINNIVDITNYVLMESAQPLHAFDFQKLAGREIIVREAKKGEKLEAIDHNTYELEPGMCVIADAKVPVALAGVMGGAGTEISNVTTDVLIESAEFNTVTVRNTARKLNLHSDSSYRFERGVDPAGVDWASRRCCELILELAGGELAQGVIHIGQQNAKRSPVVLRFRQLKRILGIDIPTAEVLRILQILGLEQQSANDTQVESIPPSWRRDLTREIDLVEEVARIHGYDQIPEDEIVPMAPSHKKDDDRVTEKIHQVLIGAGYDEAITLSMVTEKQSKTFSPWTKEPALVTTSKILKGADHLRRSLIPSLLATARTNETLGNTDLRLFELASVYLPKPNDLPEQLRMLSMVSSEDFFQVKGVLEAILQELNPNVQLDAKSVDLDLLDPNRAAELSMNGKHLGYLGEVGESARNDLKLQSKVTALEVRWDLLKEVAVLIPQYEELSQFPTSKRRFNFVVNEAIRWSELAEVVKANAGPHIEDLEFVEVYRSKQMGDDKKKLLLEITFRGQKKTLTSEEMTSYSDNIVKACKDKLGAELEDAS